MVNFTAALILTIYSIASACLITNCPKGGKRGQKPFLPDIHKNIPHKQECIRCGPSLSGQCLGPALCCGPRMSCIFATPNVVTQCEMVNMLLSGETCFLPSGDIGTCATDGVCCNSESCHIDLSCEMDPYTEVCPIDEASNFK